MRTKNSKLAPRLWMVSTMLLLVCVSSAAQISTRPPNPNITPLGPQAHQAPGGHPTITGTIYGFVYWDAKASSHLGPSICNALATTVIVANTQGPPLGSLGTQSHVTSIATVHPVLTSLNTTSYDGCAYSFGNVPLGKSLYVKLVLTQPVGMLTPSAVAQDAPAGPITLSSAPCTKLPPLTKATIGDLTGKWGTCQNVAYDVNLPLVTLPQLKPLSSSGGAGGSLGSRSGQLLNQSRPAGVLTNQSTMSAPSNTPQGTPGQLTPQKPGGGGTVQLNPQPYPPKATPAKPGVFGSNSPQ